MHRNNKDWRKLKLNKEKERRYMTSDGADEHPTEIEKHNNNANACARLFWDVQMDADRSFDGKALVVGNDC